MDEGSVVECISDDDVSVAVVGISVLFSEVSVVDISDVFDAGTAFIVDNSVVDDSDAVVFDSFDEGSAVVYMSIDSVDDGSEAAAGISIIFDACSVVVVVYISVSDGSVPVVDMSVVGGSVDFVDISTEG